MILPLSCGQPRLQWNDYTPETLQQALHAGKPVILEFCAEWSEACTSMRRTTFKDENVRSLLKPFSLIQADITRPDGLILQAREKYHLSAENVPLLIFFDADGKELENLRRSGYVSAKGLADFLMQYHHLFFPKDKLESAGKFN